MLMLHLHTKGHTLELHDIAVRPARVYDTLSMIELLFWFNIQACGLHTCPWLQMTVQLCQHRHMFLFRHHTTKADV